MFLATAAGQLFAAPGSPGSVANIELIDVDTLDQNGRSVKFARDVVGDRIVVINFIYTSCKTLCPISSAIFSRLQQSLASHGNEVRLISISLDPSTDTPKRLKLYADKFDSGENWFWLTGEAGNIGLLIKALGASTDNFRAHETITLVGDGKYGRWTQFNTLPGPEQLLAEVNRIAAARAQ